MLAVLQDLLTIDEDMQNAGCVLMRIHESGVILDCLGIEHDDVRIETILQ